MFKLLRKNMELLKNIEGNIICGELDNNHYFHILNKDFTVYGIPTELRGKGHGKSILFEIVKKYGYALSGQNIEHFRTHSARYMWDSIMTKNASNTLPEGYYAFRCVDYHGVRDALVYLGDDNKKHHIAIGKAIKSYVRDIDQNYLNSIGESHPLFQIGAYQAKMGKINHATLSEENGFGIGYKPTMPIKELIVRCGDRNPDYQLDFTLHTQLENLVVESADNNIQILGANTKNLKLVYNVAGTKLPEWVYGIQSLKHLDLTEFVALNIDCSRLNNLKTLKILDFLDNFETIKSESSFKVIRG